MSGYYPVDFVRNLEKLVVTSVVSGVFATAIYLTCVCHLAVPSRRRLDNRRRRTRSNSRLYFCLRRRYCRALFRGGALQSSVTVYSVQIYRNVREARQIDPR